MLSDKPDCESVGRDHQFESISVHNISPDNIELMITNIPPKKLYSQNWSEVIYECSLCGKMRWIEMSADEAEKEKLKIA